MKKTIRFLLIGLFSILILLVGAAFAIPYFFKDEIVSATKNAINDQLNAKVDFGEVSLSLFQDFPNLSLGLQDVRVTGLAPFENVQLAGMDDVNISLNLKSVIDKAAPIKINHLTLSKPDIHIVVLKDGTANYDITKASDAETPSESSPFKLALDGYEIEDGDIRYEDHTSDLLVDIKGLNHAGSGNFTDIQYLLHTETDIEEFTVRSAGVRYLNEVNAELDVDIDINNETNTYRISDNNLRINTMVLRSEGSIKMKEESMDMDLKFRAPENDFSSLLSLIPSAYTKDFDGIKTSGQFSFNGAVNGAYNMSTGATPPFNINLKVDNASFQYPDLPSSVDGIAVVCSVEAPSSDLDKIKIDVPEFRFLLGGEPIEGRLKLKTPISDPDLDGNLKGNINLADFSKAYPLEGVDKLDGQIKADVQAKARLSDVNNERYEQVVMDGSISISELAYWAEGSPPINIQSMQMNFSPKFLDVTQLVAKLGKSDLQAKGRIDNILAYISPEQTMKGTFQLRSAYFDANEWLSESSEEDQVVDNTEPATKPFDRFDFQIDAKFDALDYSTYKLKEVYTLGQISPSRLDIKNAGLEIGESDIRAKGQLKNLFGYAFEGQTLTGSIDLNSNNLDLNPFMVPAVENNEIAKSTANTAENEIIPVPENMDLTINANIGKLRYTDYDIRQLAGAIQVKDEEAQLQNVNMNTLGGKMTLDGAYNTQDLSNPTFNFDYGIKNLEFQKAFDKLNVIEQLAPIAKYIEGTFNSKLKMSGNLNKDMSPNLSSLNADGLMETIQGVIRNFEPLNKIGSLLDISAFQNIPIKNTKNWFKVADGKVSVEDFELKHAGMDMVIGGSHGLDNTMDYHIIAHIPRKLLEKHSAGQAVNKGLGLLQKEASKIGMNINNAEFINVKIALTGSMTDPKVKIVPTGTGGQNLKDLAKQAVEDATNEVKEEVKTTVDETKKAVKEEVAETTDKATEAAKDAGKKALEDITNDPSKAGEAVKGATEEVKDAVANPDSLKTKIDDLKKDPEKKIKDAGKKLKDLFGKKKN